MSPKTKYFSGVLLQILGATSIAIGLGLAVIWLVTLGDLSEALTWTSFSAIALGLGLTGVGERLIGTAGREGYGDGR